ncbi:MAG: type II toxin-antitoxin system RelE/ParE family toxin [Rivularia sp. (in: cyanobacteria)]
MPQDSPDVAAAWFNGLFDAVESLETMPFRCALAPEAEILQEEIRQFIYRKNYRLLYKVEGELVQIYHIRHTSQRFLKEENF